MTYTFHWGCVQLSLSYLVIIHCYYEHKSVQNANTLDYLSLILIVANNLEQAVRRELGRNAIGRDQGLEVKLEEILVLCISCFVFTHRVACPGVFTVDDPSRVTVGLLNPIMLRSIKIEEIKATYISTYV